MKKIFKKIIISLVLVAIFAVRYMLGNEAIRYSFELNNVHIQNKTLTLIGLLLVWFNMMVNLCIAFYPFFNFKTQTNLIKVFCLPVTVISFVFISVYTKAICGIDSYTIFDVRSVLLTLELSISLAYSLFITKENFTKIEKIT